MTFKRFGFNLGPFVSMGFCPLLLLSCSSVVVVVSQCGQWSMHNLDGGKKMRRKRDKNRGTWPISRRIKNFQLFLPGFHVMLCHQKNDNWKNLSKTSIHSLDGKGAKNGLLLLPPDASERLFCCDPYPSYPPYAFSPVSPIKISSFFVAVIVHHF